MIIKYIANKAMLGGGIYVAYRHGAPVASSNTMLGAIQGSIEFATGFYLW